MTPALPPVWVSSVGLLCIYIKECSAQASTTTNEVLLKVKHDLYIPTCRLICSRAHRAVSRVRPLKSWFARVSLVIAVRKS
jgi:hypothetical protein